MCELGKLCGLWWIIFNGNYYFNYLVIRFVGKLLIFFVGIILKLCKSVFLILELKGI